MRTIKTYESFMNESNSFILDTFSADDSDKIIDVLDADKIEYKKIGPKITIKIDRNTPKASILISHLHKIAKFEEI